MGVLHIANWVLLYLYNLKCVGGLSNTIFLALLELIIQLLPACEEMLSSNIYEAKKYLRNMGLGYEKISKCRNNSMLFWKGTQELDSWSVCGKSRWKDEIFLDEDGQPILSSNKRSVKVLRWFPLIPRLQRLYDIIRVKYWQWNI